MDEAVSALASSQTSAGDAATDQPINVYVWDMDETLILLKSLLDGSFAGHLEGLKDHEKGTELGKRWENIILELCDEHFFYEEVSRHLKSCPLAVY
jgi:eyes absent family protein 1